MSDYRFESCEVVPPINGHVWESVGGLRLG
jgi:hypothetical protein